MKPDVLQLRKGRHKETTKPPHLTNRPFGSPPMERARLSFSPPRKARERPPSIPKLPVSEKNNPPEKNR